MGGAQGGDRTMIDALAPVLHALDRGLAAAAVRAGAASTAAIHRANAVALLFEWLAEKARV